MVLSGTLMILSGTVMVLSVVVVKDPVKGPVKTCKHPCLHPIITINKRGRVENESAPYVCFTYCKCALFTFLLDSRQIDKKQSGRPRALTLGHWCRRLYMIDPAQRLVTISLICPIIKAQWNNNKNIKKFCSWNIPPIEYRRHRENTGRKIHSNRAVWNHLEHRKVIINGLSFGEWPEEKSEFCWFGTKMPTAPD